MILLLHPLYTNPGTFLFGIFIYARMYKYPFQTPEITVIIQIFIETLQKGSLFEHM